MKSNLKIKKLLVALLVFIGFMVGLADVNAATAPKSIKMKSKSSLYYFSESKGTDYINGYNFYRKQLTDGTYGYCVSNISTKVPAGKTLTLKGPTTDLGLDYIIQNGYPAKSFTGDAKKDYYITQSAIWAYFDQTKGTKNWKSSAFTSSSTGMKKQVYNLVQAALVAKKASLPSPELNVTVTNNAMSLNSEKTYFVSEAITVSGKNIGDTYTVKLESAPNGTIIKSTTGESKTTFKLNEKFVVYVPFTGGNVSGSVVLTLSVKGIVYRTYTYTSGSSSYQNITPVTVYEEITTVTSNKINLNYNYKEVTKVQISKQDISSKKELPGATLVVKNSAGKEIAKWVSTNTPHYIENLEPGEYTLTETIAPDGYVLSTETVKFTVKSDGSTTSVVMYNTAKPTTTKVRISKQDIASKEELAGATLVVKNSAGKEVAKWVSTNTPYYIENLPAGEYTLTEVVAPDGYILSTETVKFTVKADGSVTSVTMYNTAKPEVTKVRISKQDIATKKELPGATLVVKNSAGKEVAKWVSTSTPYYIEGLEAGEYTLTEVVAPEGYVLSTETVKFTVKDDGSVTSVIMFNIAKTEKTKVQISKQDFTSKKELPGATLVIKNKDGKEVDKWVSTDTPYYIEGLEPGEYTLTETIAPSGYILSTETITFTVKDDGSVTSVTMYNKLYEVPITDLNFSSLTIIIASILVVFGTGIVFYNAKFAKTK